MVGYHNHILFPLLTMPNEQTDKTQTHKIWATKSLKKDFKLVRKKKHFQFHSYRNKNQSIILKTLYHSIMERNTK